MASHILHPDTHEYGLADGCPRCEELALDPFAGLDDTNLTNLVARLKEGKQGRSLSESVAMSRVQQVLWQARTLQRLGALNQQPATGGSI